MIKARHKLFFNWFYYKFSVFAVRRHFSRFILDVPEVATNKPLLVLCNHHSWWDGFWVLLVNKWVLHKRYHVMMLESQLKKHRSFANIGAFSIAGGRRQMLESLNYSIGLLTSVENMVLIFPQGKLYSQHIDQLELGKGVDYIMKMNPEIEVLMLVSLTDYFENKKPQVNIYGKLLRGSNSWKSVFNDFYGECKAKQQSLWK